MLSLSFSLSSLSLSLSLDAIYDLESFSPTILRLRLKFPEILYGGTLV